MKLYEMGISIITNDGEISLVWANNFQTYNYIKKKVRGEGIGDCDRQPVDTSYTQIPIFLNLFCAPKKAFF